MRRNEKDWAMTESDLEYNEFRLTNTERESAHTHDEKRRRLAMNIEEEEVEECGICMPRPMPLVRESERQRLTARRLGLRTAIMELDLRAIGLFGRYDHTHTAR